MNIKIYHIIKRLRDKGDIGTANAIVDAFNVVKRAKLMLRRSIVAYNTCSNDADKQVEQYCIDILSELFDSDNF